MAYKNPVPDVDKSKRYRIKVGFTFDEPITMEQAAKGIYDLIIETGGIPIGWLEHADGYKEAGKK